MVDIHQAQLVKLTEKHIELTDQLQVTQKALNDMVPVLNSHSAAIDHLKADVNQLQIQLQHSFLYLAITQISHNDLTLAFLSPQDIHKVVYHVIKEGNLTFNAYPGSLPVVQIITKLLVRQQIDFVSSSQYTADDPDYIDNPDEIGRLVITSFFAVPRQEQTPFYIYKLVTVPIFQENEAIQLAGIPRYWAFNPANNMTIEWHNLEESGCDLRLMTSCRDTPPFRKISKDTCLNQIVEMLPLSKCQTTSAPADKYYLQQLRDNLWITSSRKPIHCVRILGTQYHNTMGQTGSMNEEIILPPVSLINVTEGYITVCPDFTLVGRPVRSNTSSLVILYKSGVLAKNISVMNVHQYMTENMTYFKNNVSERDRSTLMDFIKQANDVSTYRTSLSPYKQSFMSSLISSFMPSFGLLSFNWVFFGLVGVVLYYVYRCKTKK